MKAQAQRRDKIKALHDLAETDIALNEYRPFRRTTKREGSHKRKRTGLGEDGWRGVGR